MVSKFDRIYTEYKHISLFFIDITKNQENKIFTVFSTNKSKLTPYFKTFLKDNELKSNEESVKKFLSFRILGLSNFKPIKVYPIFYLPNKNSVDCGTTVLNILQSIFEELKYETNIGDFLREKVFDNPFLEEKFLKIDSEIFENISKAKLGDIILYDEFRGKNLSSKFHIGFYLGNSFVISKMSGEGLLLKHNILEIPSNYSYKFKFIRINNPEYQEKIKKYIYFFESLNFLEEEIKSLDSSNDKIYLLVDKLYKIFKLILTEKKNMLDVRKELK